VRAADALCVVTEVLDQLVKADSLTKCEHFLGQRIIINFNLLAQKHDKVTRATKQIERDSKDTDATNSCPRKVQIKLVVP